MHCISGRSQEEAGHLNHTVADNLCIDESRGRVDAVIAAGASQRLQQLDEAAARGALPCGLGDGIERAVGGSRAAEALHHQPRNVGAGDGARLSRLREQKRIFGEGSVSVY